jgi:hypothetical protein
LPANACWPLVDLTIHKNQIKYAKESSREKAFTPEPLMDLSFAYAAPLVIVSAVNNKVFDSLESEPKTAGQLATETGACERGLRIIMNALIGLGLLKKDRQGRDSLTVECSAFLMSNKPGTLAGFFGTIAPQLISKWLRLTDVVRTDPRP